MAGVNNNGESQNYINQIKAYINTHAPKQDAALLEAFAQAYFSGSSIDDLKTRSIADLYHILLSHWQFIHERAQGEAKIRIFNPSKEKDGWESSHTIIQISHDDIPFLVDSTRMVINRFGYQIHFIIHFGGFKVIRDDKNRIAALNGNHDPKASPEAPIYIEIDRLSDDATMQELKTEILSVLCDVHLAVADWRKMLDRVKECLHELDINPPPVEPADLVESQDFLS